MDLPDRGGGERLCGDRGQTSSTGCSHSRSSTPRPSPSPSRARRRAAGRASPGRWRGIPAAENRHRRTRRAGRSSSPRRAGCPAPRRLGRRARRGVPRELARASRATRANEVSSVPARRAPLGPSAAVVLLARRPWLVGISSPSPATHSPPTGRSRRDAVSARLDELRDDGPGVAIGVPQYPLRVVATRRQPGHPDAAGGVDIARRGRRADALPARVIVSAIARIGWRSWSCAAPGARSAASAMNGPYSVAFCTGAVPSNRRHLCRVVDRRCDRRAGRWARC